MQAEAKVRRYEERLDQFTSTAYASVERLTKTKNALKLVEELNSRLREERNTLQESLNAVMDQSATSHAQADVGSDGSSAQDTAQRYEAGFGELREWGGLRERSCDQDQSVRACVCLRGHLSFTGGGGGGISGISRSNFRWKKKSSKIFPRRNFRGV